MKPAISVLVCTYNRWESLKETLDSLLKQHDPGTFHYEIIIVDNNSTDKTQELVRDYSSKFNNRLRYTFEPQQGLSHARNKGIQEATGDIIVFTDDDCIVDQNWLINIHEASRKLDFDALGGRILPVYPSGSPQWIRDNQDLLCGPIVYHDYGEDTKIYQKPMIEFVGANMAFKRSVFQELGSFRSDLGAGRGTVGEETEFYKRLLEKQKKIYYCGSVLVWHPVDINRLTLKYIARWNITLGKYRMITDETKQLNPNLVYWFGVPRYLIGKILKNIVSLAVSIFNKRNFLKAWAQLHINLGEAQQTRKIYQSTHHL